MIYYKSRKTKFYDSFITMGIFLIACLIMIIFAVAFVNMITTMPVKRVTELSTSTKHIYTEKIQNNKGGSQKY